jgi:hypothetical protein
VGRERKREAADHSTSETSLLSRAPRRPGVEVEGGRRLSAATALGLSASNDCLTSPIKVKPRRAEVLYELRAAAARYLVLGNAEYAVNAAKRFIREHADEIESVWRNFQQRHFAVDTWSLDGGDQVVSFFPPTGRPVMATAETKFQPVSSPSICVCGGLRAAGNTSESRRYRLASSQVTSNAVPILALK